VAGEQLEADAGLFVSYGSKRAGDFRVEVLSAVFDDDRNGNQYLTATGSGFIPGAVVLWNGVARTTTYIDASHLQFNVSATDVTSSQAISITAENPGSGASSGITLTIH
jgi:hypothetical protein